MAAGGVAGQLRGEFARHRDQHGGRAYPLLLRTRAVAYVSERTRQGASTLEIAAELGVGEGTVARWLGQRGQQALVGVGVEGAAAGVRGDDGPTFVPVVVKDGRAGADEAHLEVVLPDGTRMQLRGLGVAALVEVMQALRSTG